MVFCGFWSKLCKSSPVKTVKTDMRSMYSVDLSSYTLACEKDPDLKSFDSSLHQRINRIISSLAARSDAQPLAIDSLAEIYELVLEMNKEAVEEVTKIREDVRKNKGIRDLVEVYLRSSAKTFDFCNAVGNCVKRAKESQQSIQLAVNQFEKESVETGSKYKYAKTLEELKKFKAFGDPFDGDFLKQYISVYEEQATLLKDLHEQNLKLNKKERKAKPWMRLSNMVFVTAFVSFLVSSVALAAVVQPQVLSALAAALTHPIEYGGKWCSDLLKAYENALKRQRGLVLSMEVQTMINREAMKNIVLQVEKWRYTIPSVLGLVQFAVEKEEDEDAMNAVMKIVMHQIKEEVRNFEGEIKQADDLVEVGKHRIGSSLPTIQL